ncbi:MAG: hypothetical protein ACR2HI_12440 [Gaiella sp.]
MRALVACALGTVLVDLGEGVALEVTEDELALSEPAVSLPLLVAADRVGARIVAVVERRPPLVVSNDAGTTWSEAGGGLPAGVDVALSPDHPDDVVYATNERLYVSRDGGRFWAALEVELPEITAVTFAT